jgi:hypothetical protein
MIGPITTNQYTSSTKELIATPAMESRSPNLVVTTLREGTFSTGPPDRPHGRVLFLPACSPRSPSVTVTPFSSHLFGVYLGAALPMFSTT